MPTLKRFASFKICMYADDHPPPHFHVVGKGFKATVLLETLGLGAGQLPPGIYAQAIAWAADHLEALHTAWRDLNERA